MPPLYKIRAAPARLGDIFAGGGGPQVAICPSDNKKHSRWNRTEFMNQLKQSRLVLGPEQHRPEAGHTRGWQTRDEWNYPLNFSKNKMLLMHYFDVWMWRMFEMSAFSSCAGAWEQWTCLGAGEKFLRICSGQSKLHRAVLQRCRAAACKSRFFIAN